LLKKSAAVAGSCASIRSLARRVTTLGQGYGRFLGGGRVVIAYCITGDTVEIVGVFYGGRDYEFILMNEPRR
jgi:plasmid stabilization system protein ParE